MDGYSNTVLTTILTLITINVGMNVVIGYLLYHDS